MGFPTFGYEYMEVYIKKLPDSLYKDARINRSKVELREQKDGYGSNYLGEW